MIKVNKSKEIREFCSLRVCNLCCDEFTYANKDVNVSRLARPQPILMKKINYVKQNQRQKNNSKININ